MTQTANPALQPQLDLTFRIAETMLVYARQVLESQLDTVQSLLTEGAATSRILSGDAAETRAAGALLAQLAQANAQHWSTCAQRVAEATVKTQATCVKLLQEHTGLDGHGAAAALPFAANPPRLDGFATQLLQPIQVMMELLTNSARPWLEPAAQGAATSAGAKQRK